MKREPGMAYNTSTLNKVFAVLSVLLLLTVLWVVMDDYIRPWKAVQIKAMTIEKQVTAAKIKKIEGSIDSKKLEEAKANLQAAEKEVERHNTEIQKIQEKVDDVQKRIYVQNMYNGVQGSQAAAWQFKFEHAMVQKHLEEAAGYKKRFSEYKKHEIEGKDQLKAYNAELEGYNKQIKTLEESKIAAEKAVKAIVGDKERLQQSMASTEITPVWLLRNSPFIDFMDPTIKIRQHVVLTSTNDFYFQQMPKIDRCTTCHVFIDKSGYEDQQNPYKTHPKIDTLAVGVNSAHPIKDFGCTSCHGGVGDRVNDFNSPAHIPQNAAQRKDWVAKYHWHEPHKVPQPMLPLQFTEGMCIKCHQGVERIPMADKLNKGRKLVEQYGCYGCHKIEGWQHLKKPGPSLEKITAKTNPEWMKNWIWSPHSFNPKSKMPSFFMQANNAAPEFMKKNQAEVNAMVTYLSEKAKPYAPFTNYKGGNADKGKELIETVGCVGCHMVEGIDEKWNAVGERKGTYLTGTGSKVNADWLVSWLKKPSHYQPDTVMPSFRLTDQEANDIASYLMNLKNKPFEGLKFPELDRELRDEILVQDYFSAFDTIEVANAKLDKMSDADRTLELGRRSIGKYGCYSCHNINGFGDDLPPIGPELTKVGSKPVEQFGFGQQSQVPHTREGWLAQHLKQPSIWDLGVPKPFKDLNRMPNFYLKDWEIESIMINLLGQVSDKVPLLGQKRLNENEKLAEIGKKVVNKYNCQGCHNIDGNGGSLSKAFDDAGQGPPWLMKEGHRVQSEWFNNFLQNVHTIRPYVKVRMPSFNFSNDELNKIVTYFQADSEQATFENLGPVQWEPGEREAAQKIWNELACTTCHTIGFTNDDPQAPALKNAKMRLRPTWIEKWLSNPTEILPYTSMPNFWEGGTISPVEGVLDNDPKKQIRAVRKFVQEMGNSSYPAPLPKN
ncbi:MAG: c-type cytochrome [Bacteriovoracaceae bacterium]|nr:c-type cytochrome [Bacteriovoracaceae bacterium]